MFGAIFGELGERIKTNVSKKIPFINSYYLFKYLLCEDGNFWCAGIF